MSHFIKNNYPKNFIMNKKMEQERVWKHKNLEEKPSFYKLILPVSTIAEQMQIPPEITDHIDECAFEKATLRDRSGRGWPVKLHKTEKGVFVKEGWKQFFHSHFLSHFEFLIFIYDGETCFHVRIFGRNGLERVIPVRDHAPSGSEVSFEHCSEDEIKSGREEVYDVSPLNVARPFIEKRKSRRPRKKSKNSLLNLQPALSPHTKAPGQDVARLESRELKQHGVPKSSKKNNRQIICMENKNGRGKVSSANHDHEKRKRGRPPGSRNKKKVEGPLELGYHTRPNNKECPNVKTKEEIIEVYDEPGPRFKKFNSCEMQDGILMTTDACVPVFPSFEKHIKVYDVKHPYKISLPKAFADSKLPNTHTTLVLRNEKGRSWAVNFLPHRTCPQLGGGWVLFMRENKLKSGDHCIFELVKENEMNVKISFCGES